MPRCCSTLVTLHGSFLQNLVVCLITRLVQIYIFILIWNSLLKSPKNMEQELFFLILQVQQQKSELQQQTVFFSQYCCRVHWIFCTQSWRLRSKREEGRGRSREEDSSKRPPGHNGGG